MSSGKSEQESGRWVVRVPRSRMRCRGEQSRRRSRSRSRESKDGEVEVEVRSDFRDGEVMSDFRDGEVMSDFKKKIEDERRKGRGRSRESKDSIRAKPKTNGHDWKIDNLHPSLLLQQIPAAFLMHFNGNVPQQFHLRTSAGTWCVNVEKINDRFFFQKGWKKFVHDNGLEICEFLVFRYAFNLRFYVDIYGRNGCKKEFVTVTGKTERLHEKGHDHVIQRKTPRNHENQNVDNRGLKGSTYGTRTSQGTTPIQDEGYEATDDTDSQTLMHPRWLQVLGKLIPVGETMFLDLKTLFSRLKCGTRISIDTVPSKFVNAHLIEQPSTITLRVSDGRTWRVKLSFTARKKLKIITSRPQQCVPYKFVKTHLADHPSNLTLCVSDGRTWPVNLVYEGPKGRFIGGWSAFRQDNDLKLDDVCVFVLVNKVELFEVAFYRKPEAANICAL
ncbi:putative B3 domain-containing protein Os03g0621600 [Pyrus communis]|uniref:putative B3 domain-containing protein Os03g0621600 n=1 Tax=Pyrus communis TaxID=23211 RepID=UPI0035BFA32D